VIVEVVGLDSVESTPLVPFAGAAVEPAPPPPTTAVITVSVVTDA
jgi:hypothetical protein